MLTAFKTVRVVCLDVSTGLIIELDNAQWLRGVDDLRPWDELIRHRTHLDLGRSSL